MTTNDDDGDVMMVNDFSLFFSVCASAVVTVSKVDDGGKTSLVGGWCVDVLIVWKKGCERRTWRQFSNDVSFPTVCKIRVEVKL